METEDVKVPEPSNTQPIIQLFSAYDGYQFEAIGSEVLALIEDASPRLKPGNRPRKKILVQLTECILRISDKRLSLELLAGPESRSIYRTFVGGLYSNIVIDRPFKWKHGMLVAFNELFAVLHDKADQAGLRLSTPTWTSGVTPEIQSCIDDFLRLQLNDEEVRLWRSWLTVTRSGSQIALPLYPLYRSLGREFTDQFYSVCDTFARSRKGNAFSGLKQLIQFIAQHPTPLKPTDFKNPRFVATFWRSFLKFYMLVRYADGSGLPVSSLVSEWRKRVAYFVSHALEPSGLFAKPLGEFPSPEARYVPGSETNIKTTNLGYEIKTKLITNIPLQIADDEAMHLLFYQIQADRDIFVAWADWATKDIWSSYQRRLALAPQGIVPTPNARAARGQARRESTARSNPEYLRNAAATFQHYGFGMPSRFDYQNNFPAPLIETARELGLPITDALYPHCVILVSENQAITPSFLENLELFDRNGDMSGYIRIDGVPTLVGTKPRRGARLAQQIIHLSDRAATVIEQMIALTQSARDHLRAKQSDDWRYLLLTCRQGFRHVARVKDLSIVTTCKSRIETFAESLANTCDLDRDARLNLVRRFSLPALRSSSAVLFYLETGSVEEMAKALGHASYDPRLISSYLPEPIANFFQERWIRIFQLGVVVVALSDSDYLFDATGFKSMSELDEFLKNHALKTLPKHLENGEESDAERKEGCVKGEVVFGVNTGILTALLSLQAAVERSDRLVCGKAKYWSGITRRLVSYIEADLSGRPDLKRQLTEARLAVNPSAMQALLYA